MQTATKKPVTIEFVIFDGANDKEVTAFTNGVAQTKPTIPFSQTDPDRDRGYVMVIRTLEGEMTAQVGDYIIKGIKGEFYPCKPDIFLSSYNVN